MLKHCRPDILARGHLSLLHRERHLSNIGQGCFPNNGWDSHPSNGQGCHPSNNRTTVHPSGAQERSSVHLPSLTSNTASAATVDDTPGEGPRPHPAVVNHSCSLLRNAHQNCPSRQPYSYSHQSPCYCNSNCMVTCHSVWQAAYPSQPALPRELG